MKTSVIGSLQAYVLDRPPVVTFTLSLAAITVSIFLVAFFFKDRDFIVDSHAQEDWTSFTNYFINQKFCVDKSRVDQSSRLLPTDIQSLSSRFSNRTLLLGNVTGLAIDQTQLFWSNKSAIALIGALSFAGWERSCRHQYKVLSQESAELNITVIIPLKALKSSNVSCVYVSGPSYFHWPAKMKTNPENVSGLSQMHQCHETLGEIVETFQLTALTEHSGDLNSGCKTGNAVQMTYDLRDFESETYLSGDDKIRIFSRLLQIGYLLLSLILILLVCAIFIGRNLLVTRRHTLLPTKETMS